jgi:hypothetical protein
LSTFLSNLFWSVCVLFPSQFAFPTFSVSICAPLILLYIYIVYQGYTNPRRLNFVSSVWNLLDVTQFSPRILGWLLDVLENLCTPVVGLIAFYILYLYQDFVRSADF